jgi:hypothetical protein
MICLTFHECILNAIWTELIDTINLHLSGLMHVLVYMCPCTSCTVTNPDHID